MSGRVYHSLTFNIFNGHNDTPYCSPAPRHSVCACFCFRVTRNNEQTLSVVGIEEYTPPHTEKQDAYI